MTLYLRQACARERTLSIQHVVSSSRPVKIHCGILFEDEVNEHRHVVVQVLTDTSEVMYQGNPHPGELLLGADP
jgi:hypothetical protein